MTRSLLSEIRGARNQRRSHLRKGIWTGVTALGSDNQPVEGEVPPPRVELTGGGGGEASMTEAQRRQAALDDPDAQPLTEKDFTRMKGTPRAKIIRRALGLSQEEFAARYQIPIGTLRDWEQGRVEPDQAAKTYLMVIARDPEGVRRALDRTPSPSP